MLLTVFTSLTFGIVSLYSYSRLTKRCFTVLTIVSTLNHATSNPITRIQSNKLLLQTDRIIAHGIAVYGALDAINHYRITPYYIVYWLSLYWVVHLFKIGRQAELPGRRGELYHCSTHVVASIGSICLDIHKRNILIGPLST